MKKLFLSAILIACSLVGANAQNVDLSVKAGVGASTWVGDASDGTNCRFAYRVGVGVDVPVKGMWGFQTGLNFEGIGTNFDVPVDDIDLYSNQLYLEVPLMATARFDAGSGLDIVVNAGPYLGVGVGGKTKANVGLLDKSVETDTFGDNGLHRFDMGMGLGVNLEIDHFIVGVDTRYGFLHLADNTKAYNIGLFFNVGYKF